MLVVSNILGGVGVASGIAVGALLVEQVGGTSLAGLGQAMSVLGAAVAAVPLVAVATRWGRRWALTLGYTLAVLGGALVVVAATLGSLVLLLLGLGLFGVAQATNLQTRYAASELAPAATRARTMSIVVWVTTIGSVAGPNLTAAGARLGVGVGVPALAGPYLFSVAAFALAGTVLGLCFRPGTGAGIGPARERSGSPASAPSTAPVHPVGATGALRWAARHPVARFAVVLITAAHATMVMVMAMTPLHMHHDGMSLEVVGIVISAHIMGMYALSPVFGWLTDRYGALRVAIGGIGIFAAAIALGLVAAAGAGLARDHGGAGPARAGLVGQPDRLLGDAGRGRLRFGPGAAAGCHRCADELRRGGGCGRRRAGPRPGRLPGGEPRGAGPAGARGRPGGRRRPPARLRRGG